MFFQNSRDLEVGTFPTSIILFLFVLGIAKIEVIFSKKMSGKYIVSVDVLNRTILKFETNSSLK